MKEREIMIKTGDIVELTIDSVTHQGEGVGRYEGMAVFVPQAIPGEHVSARIVEVKKNFARGQVAEIHSSSPYRQKPGCSAFEACGGSRLQHIEYNAQLDIKRTLVEGSLTRIGKIEDVSVNPVLGMDYPWEYRNKAQFQVGTVDGRTVLGFFGEGSHRLVPASGCMLMHKDITNTAVALEKLLNQYEIKPYDWKTGAGFLRHVVIRRSQNTGYIMVIIVTSEGKVKENPDKPLKYLQHQLKALAQELTWENGMITSVMQNINTSRSREVFGRKNVLLAGQATITDTIGDLIFNISPQSFFQVNPRQTEVLYQKALEYAGLTGGETVLDVYCGIGTLSLFLAKKAGRVVGFELSEAAIKDARENAAANRIANVEFVSGKAEEKLPELVEQGIKPEVVVVDPPRQGVERPALEAIAELGPERIVYVSCDPSTLARDVAYLRERGYKVKEVQPVDMFPQTAHVECIIMMTYCGDGKK